MTLYRIENVNQGSMFNRVRKPISRYRDRSQFSSTSSSSSTVSLFSRNSSSIYSSRIQGL